MRVVLYWLEVCVRVTYPTHVTVTLFCCADLTVVLFGTSRMPP